MWKRVGSILRFSYDDKGQYGLDSTCFATGNNLSFICAVLNSKMGHYLLKDAPKTGTGDLLISVQAVEPIRIPCITNSQTESLARLCGKMIQKAAAPVQKEIDALVYELYNLTNEEIAFIDSH